MTLEKMSDSNGLTDKIVYELREDVR